jgi:hypothetical protein
LSSGKSFSNCSALSLDECTACDTSLGSCPVNQSVVECTVTKVDCSYQSCLSSGYCEGQGPLLHDSENHNIYGACAFPKNKHPVLLQGCQIQQVTYKNVCLDYAFPTQSSCITNGGVWLEPSTTQQECEAYQGLGSRRFADDN